jgi:ankyrin repeat protein
MKTFNPRPTFKGSLFGNFHNPERKIDMGVIETVFGVVRSGNYNDIKKVISEQNTTFNLTNNDNENLLHVIIKNNNDEMNEDQKYDLIEYLINNGVSISGYDKNNVTPLHLAAKYQLPKIVDLLLKSGANPNASDDQYMTPIHYATQGSIIECKPEKRVKSIIPKSTIDISANPKSEFKQATAKIIDLLNTDELRIYTTHIKRSIGNVKNIYMNDFRQIDMKYKNKIGKIISDSSITSVQKEQTISRIMTDTVNEIRDILTEKIRSSTSEVDIRPGQPESTGWGPDNNNNILVLPNIQEKLLNDLKILINSNKINTINKIETQSNLIETNIGTLLNNMRDIISKLIAVRKILYFVNYNDNNKFLILYDRIEQIYITNYDNFNYPDININKIVNKTNPNFSIPPQSINNIKIYYGSTENRKRLEKGKKIINKKPLLDLTGTNNISLVEPIDNLYNKPWIISKLYFAINQIYSHNRIIRYNLYEFYDSIRNDKKFHQIYHNLLTQIVFSIVNMYQYIDLAKNSFKENNIIISPIMVINL